MDQAKQKDQESVPVPESESSSESVMFGQLEDVLGVEKEYGSEVETHADEIEL